MASKNNSLFDVPVGVGRVCRHISVEGTAVSVLIVLHCTFYMVNIHRWNKKM